jgi:hypothetical protein
MDLNVLRWQSSLISSKHGLVGGLNMLRKQCRIKDRRRQAVLLKLLSDASKLATILCHNRKCSYSSRECAINSGKPTAISKLAATRPAKVCQFELGSAALPTTRRLLSCDRYMAAYQGIDLPDGAVPR